MDENTLKWKMTVCTLTSVIVSFQSLKQQHVSPPQYVWGSQYLLGSDILQVTEHHDGA